MTDTRSSALFKRAEQLKRWEESDTNKQSTLPKRSSRVQFSPGIVFLAACTAGDKDEVQKLLKKGADINTANVDGLTALHQACIDDNLEMVEYLVANGADVNRGDNEGWTPLHATASCGFLSIARFLIENGANVDVVNHDGELPVDIADSNSMTELLKKVIEEKGIDCEKSRTAEADSLLNDARNWAQNGYVDVRDPKTGGTPLHVAAAKGYLNVAQTLLEDCHMDSDCLDDDGWSPLHAAALWAHKDAISLLLKYGADPLLKNYAGQTCLDLVDPSISAWLNETLKKNRMNNNNDEEEKRKPNRPQLPPPSPQAQPQPQPQAQHVQEHKRVQVHITGQTDEAERDTNARAADVAGDDPPSWRRSASFRKQPEVQREADRSPDNDTILRRAHSFENDKTFYQRYRDVTARIKATSCPSIPPAPAPVKDTADEVQIRLNPIDKTKKEKEANTKSTPAANQTVRRSFVPPVRDEESETQRKAHAKRVRETRRSTQGVTLDEIKSAEQLVNKKPTENHTPRPEAEAPASNATVTAPVTAPSAVPAAANFELEDAGATTVTLPLRRPPSGAPPPPEEKESRESSTESKSSSGGASPASTQAALNVIQRRRRPKRRSTGFGNVDMDEIVNNAAEADGEVAQSGSERTESEDTENRDYKALYEASMVEVRRLRALLTTSEQQLRDARGTITKLTQLNQNPLSEIDKREKRALERKLSEMEEELKYQQTLQTENQRLKDENGALIRVISKLSK